MQKLISAALILLLATPSSALAWGAVGHRFITEKAIEILDKHFGSVGAAHKDLKQDYLLVTKQSESTFNRVIRKLKDNPRVRFEGKKYYAIRKPKGVAVNEASSDAPITSG